MGRTICEKFYAVSMLRITAVCPKPMKFCLGEKYKRKYTILIFFFLADSHRYTERNQEDGESKQRGRV